MRNNILLSLIIAGVLSVNSYALHKPKSSKLDSRITYAKYNADDVFLIKARTGYVSMLKFDDKERIVNIATGFSDGWDLIDRDNFLFIKPKAYVAKPAEQVMTDEDGREIEFNQSFVIQPNEKDWKTNLIVTTNKRIYVFDLTLIDEDKMNYKVEFSYPEEEKRKLEALSAASKKADEAKKKEEEIEASLKTTSIPRNWEFYMHVNKGSDTIAPDFAYDDGVFTYIGFNNTKTIPSVFLYEEINGEARESILNTHIKKDGKYDVLVIHKTAPKILLRSGDKLVGILNSGYAKNPLDETRTTISNQVEREIIR